MDALKTGLLPRNTLYIIGKEYKRNHRSKFELTVNVKGRLMEILKKARESQAQDDVDVINVTFKDNDMQNDAYNIMDGWDKKRGVNSPEGIMAGRIYVKLLKHASLCSIINDKTSAGAGLIRIDEESWKWAKMMMNVEEDVNGIYIEGIGGGSPMESAIRKAKGFYLECINGTYSGNNKKVEKQMTKGLRAYKVIPLNMIRDVLGKTMELKAIDSAAGGHVVNTSVDKVNQYMVREKMIELVGKNPQTNRKCNMVKVLEAIKDS